MALHLFIFASSLSIASSGIDRVVVYADRAEITRSASIECGPGPREAEFADLPATADERTLVATASGRAHAIGTSSRIVPADAARDQKRAAAEAELEKVRGRLSELRDRSAENERRSSLVGAYGNYLAKIWSEEARNPKPDPEAWKKTLDAMKKERTEAAKQEILANRERRREEENLKHVSQRLVMLQAGASKAEVRRVTVPIDCAGETKTIVLLAYVVPGATWHPEYDLRFQLDAKKGGAKVGDGRAELDVAAVVQQATGEDWTNAEIVLSTAKPKLGVEAPQPAPIYLYASEQEGGKVLVQATERRDQLEGEGKDAQKTGPTSAALDDGGHVFTLTIPNRATVLSDGRPYWMPVDVKTAPAVTKLVAVPKIRPFVYQMVSFANPAPYPLLAGRVHAYRRGSYVGDVSIRYVAPGEPMELSLGADEELFIERKDVTELDKGPGFLSSTKTMERAYRVKLRNRAAVRTAIEVRESIPVSKVGDVKVELIAKKTTPSYKLDAERGFLVWSVDLQRGEEKSVDIGYVVKLPSSWKVQ
jgi:uncharacterized protein (TIGR02231 family)